MRLRARPAWRRVAPLAVLLAAFPDAVAAESGYRTVVVFGDTQDLVSGDPALYEGFRAMVDWVLAHRQAERIDFVLHVGDAIRDGLDLPIPEACLDAAGRCDPQRRFGRSERPPRCKCHSLDATDEQWRRFDAQWRRLDGVLPYAIVPGNHDNLGVDDPASPRDRPGFLQHFGEARFRAVPGSGHLESHRDAQGVSHAFRFRLGERPLLVLALADRMTGAGLAWARSVLARHPDLPALALAHRLFDGIPPDPARPRPVWEQVVARHPDRFALAVWGHVSLGEVRLVELGGRRLLRLRSDWQGATGLQTFLSLVRFHEGEGGPALEVLAFDPVRGRADPRRGFDTSPATRGRTWLPRTPFSLDPPARRR